MTYKIVNPTENDLKFILSLNQSSVPAVSSANVETMTHFLDISTYFKLLKVNKDPVGFLIGISPDKNYDSENYQWFNSRYDSFIYVDRIAFKNQFQNKGYGTIFYDDLKRSFENKVHIIACEVNIKPYNMQSINFHKKYGFTEIAREYIEDNKKKVSYMIYEMNS